MANQIVMKKLADKKLAKKVAADKQEVAIKKVIQVKDAAMETKVASDAISSLDAVVKK